MLSLCHAGEPMHCILEGSSKLAPVKFRNHGSPQHTERKDATRKGFPVIIGRIIVVIAFFMTDNNGVVGVAGVRGG